MHVQSMIREIVLEYSKKLGLPFFTGETTGDADTCLTCS